MHSHGPADPHPSAGLSAGLLSFLTSDLEYLCEISQIRSTLICELIIWVKLTQIINFHANSDLICGICVPEVPVYGLVVLNSVFQLSNVSE